VAGPCYLALVYQRTERTTWQGPFAAAGMRHLTVSTSSNDQHGSLCKFQTSSERSVCNFFFINSQGQNKDVKTVRSTTQCLQVLCPTAEICLGMATNYRESAFLAMFVKDGKENSGCICMHKLKRPP
jgi:hypothetical protein